MFGSDSDTLTLDDVETIHPRGEWALIEPDPPESMSPGGVIIPDTAQDRAVRGTVLRVGRGQVLRDGALRPIDIAPGDRVVFSKWSGFPLRVRGEGVGEFRRFLLIQERDIHCTMEE